MKLYTFHYTIDFTQEYSNYVNAIARYNKFVEIEKINGTSLKKKPEDAPFLLKNLPSYINNYKLEKRVWQLDCPTGNSLSTIDIFPKLTNLQEALKDYVPNDRDLSIAKQASENVTAYVKEYFDLKGKERMVHAPELPELNTIQAFLMLNELNNSIKLTGAPGLFGAIHLAKQKTIIFQHGRENYELKYGNPTSVQMAIFPFSVATGFAHEKNQTIVDKNLAELQKPFLAWQANNYVGDLFPDKDAGFDLNAALIESKKMAKEKRRENNAILYRHQKAERREHNIRIGIYATLAAISAFTIILLPLTWFLLKKKIPAEFKAKVEKDEVSEKIWKVVRSGKKEDEIRQHRREFKMQASSDGLYKLLEDKAWQNSSKEVVKLVNHAKKDRDNMFTKNGMKANKGKSLNERFKLFQGHKQRGALLDEKIAQKVAALKFISNKKNRSH